MTGIDYIVEDTVRKIKEGMSPVEAFAWVCDDQNYYGTRPDVVGDRQVAAERLRARGYKSITSAVARMDPVQILEMAGHDVPPWYKSITRAGFAE